MLRLSELYTIMGYMIGIAGYILRRVSGTGILYCFIELNHYFPRFVVQVGVNDPLALISIPR